MRYIAISLTQMQAHERFALAHICTFGGAHIKENLPGHISGADFCSWREVLGRGMGASQTWN